MYIFSGKRRKTSWRSRQEEDDDEVEVFVGWAALRRNRPIFVGDVFWYTSRAEVRPNERVSREPPNYDKTRFRQVILRSNLRVARDPALQLIKTRGKIFLFALVRASGEVRFIFLAFLFERVIDRGRKNAFRKSCVNMLCVQHDKFRNRFMLRIC